MNAITLFAFLTLLSNIALVVVLVFWRKLIPKISGYALDLALLVSVFSTLGSLFMSNVLYLPPCDLCWYQRIFMYPLVVIFIIGKVRKIKKIWEIILPLAVIGGIIAAYHYLIQLFPVISQTCLSPVSCTSVAFIEFGYITIPWMSLSAFVWIIVLMLVLKRNGQKN